jgi:AraC-like DNA-binding protein/quercetin dioxygenase-like cupin family protein
MSPPRVPVHDGCLTSRTVEVGPFRVTSARFPRLATIPPHTHDRPCLAFMLGGSFDLIFPGRRPHACAPGSVFIEPAGETHCNCLGTAGADVLVLQPDPAAETLPRPAAASLLAPAHFRHAGLTMLARRMASEMAEPDPVTPLALEGLALELLALVARQRAVPPGRPAPRWLARAEELIRERFLERLSWVAVAGEVGVHPAHLARAFRARHRSSIGRFVRSLRLEWAAAQLAGTTRSIATIAADAGFADQSHFTRRFREMAGATPERWRRSHRPDWPERPA